MVDGVGGEKGGEDGVGMGAEGRAEAEVEAEAEMGGGAEHEGAEMVHIFGGGEGGVVSGGRRE